jgi:class 3 adenylate cyclase
MGTDEEGTLARLKALRRELADPKIKELIEFASVVDAVRCAVEVQREMANRNADVPPDRRIEFRMGITSAARMAASLRSTRPVAKAVLPNRMGRIDHRLYGLILAVNASAATPFR